MKERNLGGAMPWWKGHVPDIVGVDGEGHIKERLDALAQGYAQRVYTTYAIWLPLPPSVNRAYRDVVVQRGQKVFCRRASTQAKEDWEEVAHLLANVAGFPHATEKSRAHFALRLTVALSSWRRDIDNVTKIALDFLAGRLGLDDRYLVSELVQRLPVLDAEQEGVLARVNVFRD